MTHEYSHMLCSDSLEYTTDIIEEDIAYILIAFKILINNVEYDLIGTIVKYSLNKNELFFEFKSQLEDAFQISKFYAYKNLIKINNILLKFKNDSLNITDQFILFDIKLSNIDQQRQMCNLTLSLKENYG